MNNNTVVEKIVDYIETHINEDLSLDKIAKALNYSKFYIARIFTEETKCTVYKYIQGRRLTLAAQKLVETEQPIVEIAYEAHYDSQQAFTLAFNSYMNARLIFIEKMVCSILNNRRYARWVRLMDTHLCII